MNTEKKRIKIKTLYIAERNYPTTVGSAKVESQLRNAAKWITSESNKLKEIYYQDSQNTLAIIALDLKLKMNKYEPLLERLDRQLGLYLERQSSLNKKKQV